jgi:homoserine dehydrogenase
MKTIKLGLIGFGIVGSGVVKILSDNSDIISHRLGAKLELVKIADLDIETDRGVKVEPGVLTKDADEILTNPEIDIVIELIGGMEPAKSFIMKAMANGKRVVTANKALLAKHGDEVFLLAEEKAVALGFEAAVAGCIPIIRTLKESFAATKIKSIIGIVNGTANYILSQMTEKRREFDDVLKEAQELGFAEADPTFDIEGIDTAHKAALLTRLAYGTSVNFDEIYIQGISDITLKDIDYAKEFGYKIKLLAISKINGDSVEVRVHPAMVPINHSLAQINGVFNAVQIYDDLMEKNTLIGHGAGSLPTASAVIGDVIESARDILFGLSSRVPAQAFNFKNFKNLPVTDIRQIETEYFLRFNALDKPGVLSVISGILGEHSISIKSVIQKGRDEGNGVPLILMTHQAREENIQDALGKLNQTDVISEKPIVIRCES